MKLLRTIIRTVKRVDRATGRIRDGVVKGAARLVKAYRKRNGQRVRAHRRNVIAADLAARGKPVKRRSKPIRRKLTPKRKGVPRAFRPTLIEKLYPRDDDWQDTYNPEHQEWLKTHGGLCGINWRAGRQGDGDTFLLSFLLIQNPKR